MVLKVLITLLELIRNFID
ncbi:hypothetical protein ACOIP5_005123 [Salmonella enterica]